MLLPFLLIFLVLTGRWPQSMASDDSIGTTGAIAIAIAGVNAPSDIAVMCYLFERIVDAIRVTR
jgi:hypothetical protein